MQKESKSKQPSERGEGVERRVGLLGTGYISEYHAKALRATPGTRLVAVCDRSLPRAQSFARDFGVESVFGSLDEMLAEGGLDAVHVLTPPNGHFAPAERLLEAGVATLLEKPMSISVGECDKLVALSQQRGVPLGIAHNFLFAEPYEQLRKDLREGELGQIDCVSIKWHKPLPQVNFGPFDLWMLRDPGNILFEIGPHPFGQLLDLVGMPDHLTVTASNEIELPTGAPFFRRWHIYCVCGNAAVDVNLSFQGGFSEHSIHVRGRTASATVDLENDTYVRHRHVPSDMDFDRYAMMQNESRAIVSQARKTLLGYVASKVRPSPRGNPYCYSIARAIERFYEPLGNGIDSRLSPSMGRDIIAFCERVRDAGPVAPSRAVASAGQQPTVEPSSPPRVLVLGATGFIGKSLVQQLVARGTPTRVLVRSAGRVPGELVAAGVHVVVGDCANAKDLDCALEGIECVVHLARPNVKSWSDYQVHEIEMTRLVAERSLAKGVSRFVYSGTIDSYFAGPGAGTITENTPLDPNIRSRNFYARSKAISEQILLDLYRQRGLPLLIFRPGIVIGRGGSPLHWGIGMWKYDSICQIWGSGNNKLPLVLVDDVVKGLIAGIDAPASLNGESFNLIDDPILSANEYLDELDRLAGVKIQRFHTPIAAFYSSAMFKWVVKVLVKHPEHVMPSYSDWASRTQMAIFECSKAKQQLGWKPASDRSRLVNEGIGEPVREWFR